MPREQLSALPRDLVCQTSSRSERAPCYLSQAVAFSGSSSSRFPTFLSPFPGLRALVAKSCRKSDAHSTFYLPGSHVLRLRLISADVKDIMFPGEMKKAVAQLVKAQKEGQTALERARGETAALRSLANAARTMDDNPNLLQLRALQAIADSSGSTLVLGLPSSAVSFPKHEKSVIPSRKETKEEEE